MILSCGEALIDMLPRTTADGEAAFAPYAGGAVFNTAVAIGRLGAPSAFFSGVSTDLLGELLAEKLRDAGVDMTATARSGRPTTVAFVKLTDGHATYAFYDENTAGRMLTEADLPTLRDDAQAAFFGGISLINEPAASTYEALQAREAERAGAQLGGVALDVEHGEDGAHGTRFLLGCGGARTGSAVPKWRLTD